LRFCVDPYRAPYSAARLRTRAAAARSYVSSRAACSLRPEIHFAVSGLAGWRRARALKSLDFLRSFCARRLTEVRQEQRRHSRADSSFGVALQCVNFPCSNQEKTGDLQVPQRTRCWVTMSAGMTLDYDHCAFEASQQKSPALLAAGRNSCSSISRLA